MRKFAAGVAALFVVVSSPALAQNSSVGLAERVSQGDLTALTDARINIVKAALQLSPDQEKYWPAIEDAIRNRAKDRSARLERAMAQAEEWRQRGPVEMIRNRNPVEFMHQRAEEMTRRADDLKKLADAWQPLYQTLTPEQKRRMGTLTVLVLREMMNAAEERHLQAAEEYEED